MKGDPRLIFIFVTLAIDSIGLGIVIPVLPDVIRRFLSDESSVSRTYGYFVAIYALMQFVSSPLLGRLSDRFGRRPILLVSLFGAGVDYIFMAFAGSLPLVFIGRLISGVSGASYSVASAYIADISNDENRSRNFGIIGAGFGLGFIIGPAIGGFLGSYGAIYPFLAGAAFNLLNFLFGLFVLPESLPLSERRAIDYRAANPLLAIRAISRVERIRPLIVAFFLLNLAGQTHPSIWTLYTQHRYGWTSAEVGMSLAVVGVLSAISQGALTGTVVRLLGERRVLVYGVLGEAVSYLLFGLSSTALMLYTVLVVSSVFWTSQPVLQSVTSRDVPPSEQGELQGALMSLVSLSSILNPLLMTELFALASDRNGAIYLPGAPYMLGGALLLMAWFILRRAS